MRHLKREIQIRQAMVLEDRVLLAARTGLLRHRVMGTLATPKALAGSFGVGLIAGLLRRPHKVEHAEPAETHAGGRSWMQVLVHDLVMPIAMGAIQARLGQSDHPSGPE